MELAHWAFHAWIPASGVAIGAYVYRMFADLYPRCRFDDLLEEEREEVQIALKRLSPKESYERIYRIRRSVQCSYQHKLLPREQWTKPEDVSSGNTHHPQIVR